MDYQEWELCRICGEVAPITHIWDAHKEDDGWKRLVLPEKVVANKSKKYSKYLNSITVERFLNYVHFFDSLETCWYWKGSKTRTSHGTFSYNGRAMPAYRFSYMLLRGPIPEGLVLDHLCINTWCVNPWHLEPVTAAENSRRRFRPDRLLMKERNEEILRKWKN